MREYEVKIDTGLCGYDFECDMMLMHKRAHICKVIDNGIID